MQPDLARYSCQVALPGFGVAGQQALQQAKVFIAGAGGLGCPAAQYLAAAGAGTIAIADYDTISISNLHRQVLYTPAEAGLKKTQVLCKKLQEQNPGITLLPIDLKIGEDNVLLLIDGYDIVVDCTDNFESRYLLNDACVLSGKPLVYGAIYRYEGQVAVWNVVNKDGARSPNYRDLFPEVNAAQIPNCAEGGVLPALAGIIGCMQANEVIKFITGTGALLTGKLLTFDAQTLHTRIIKLAATTTARIPELIPATITRTITWQELNTLAKEAYELIDVRSEEEREIFNVGGRHIPLQELENNDTDFDNGKMIVFYCATGKRSAEAVNVVKKQNSQVQAISLKDGIDVLLK